MAKVAVNNSTFTEVLDGAGFCTSDATIEYEFGATQPSGTGSFLRNPRDQMNGAAGKKLWAKACAPHTAAEVTSVAE